MNAGKINLMAREFGFGIVGGHGATGRAVASELLRSGDERILIGGRDGAKAQSAASELGNRASATKVDVFEPQSLDEFCGRCSVVINCGGPVMLLQDRVAQAAFQARCHYVDAADMSIVRERMLARSREIKEMGLAFVISAGWMPGLTELLPAYAYAQAKGKLDSIDSVSVYYADSGEWSESALRDGVCYLRKKGMPKPGYFRKGQLVRAKMTGASAKVDLGAPIGRRRFSLFSMPELDDLGRRLSDCEFRAYSYVAGFQNAVAAMTIALAPISEDRGVRLLRNVFRRNRLAVGGFVVVHVRGRSGGEEREMRFLATFQPGQDYWMNGAVLATVARMIAAGRAEAGVHYLADAVDPDAAIAELRKAGVNISPPSGMNAGAS